MRATKSSKVKIKSIIISLYFYLYVVIPRAVSSYN